MAQRVSQIPDARPLPSLPESLLHRSFCLRWALASTALSSVAVLASVFAARDELLGAIPLTWCFAWEFTGRTPPRTGTSVRRAFGLTAGFVLLRSLAQRGRVDAVFLGLSLVGTLALLAFAATQLVRPDPNEVSPFAEEDPEAPPESRS